MSCVQFEYLRPTTMTLIISIQGEIDRDVAFSLFPITMSNTIWKSGQKLPHPGKPGIIISARYKGCIRGIVKTKTRTSKKEKKCFKHSITTDMSIVEKTVNMKISSNNIHLCGATCIEHGREAVEYLISIVKKIQEDIDYMHSHSEIRQDVVTFIQEYGHRVFGNDITNEERKQTLLGLYLEQMTYTESHMRLFDLYTRSIHEFTTYDDYIKELTWIQNVKHIYTGDLKIETIYTAMIKYNFDLGFNVNRQKLAVLINGIHGFRSRYDNSSEHYVSIRKPYTEGEDIFQQRKKNKIPGHKFSVYESGIVTQSGRGDQMKHIYDAFNDAISQIRPEIMKQGNHILRYIPSYPCIETPSSTSFLQSEEIPCIS